MKRAQRKTHKKNSLEESKAFSVKMNKKEVFKLAKGFRGRAKNCIRIARERVEKALQYSYRDRRNKKRDMRSLWIQRINAGTRQHGVRLSSLFFHIFSSIDLGYSQSKSESNQCLILLFRLCGFFVLLLICLYLIAMISMI